MMEVSRRARRMERHHKMRKQPALNLVSLMDIFTILVFFLLVNSSSTQQLPSTKDLTLPTSITNKAPDETLVIAVTREDVLVQGRKVAEIAVVLADGGDEIVKLKEELEFHANRRAASRQDPAEGKSVTIMGDENIPYDLVRKILKTCQLANYTKIAFAANQVAKEAID